ncbi:MAG TPA: aspartate aminotransferase, partial [Alcanivorax sp.]|nr:aspartate aminotransferase [Alcanivorax sp.]
AGVAVVPGSGFGAPGRLRVSFAADMHTIETGLRRLREFLR